MGKKKDVEKTGMCKFCGQQRFLMVPEDWTDEQLNDEVSYQCKCEAGKIWRAGVEDEKRIQGMIEESKGISFALLNAKNPEIEQLVNELVPQMVKFDIKSVVLCLSAETKIKIKRSTNSIKIFRSDNRVEGGEAKK